MVAPTMLARCVWCSKDGRYTVELSSACVIGMIDLANKNRPLEVGTALVGSYSDDGCRVLVSGLAPMTEDSIGSHASFYRGDKGLVDFFRDLFRGSDGQVHYVGEWHSHPDGAPEPSEVDDCNAMATAKDPRAQCPECVHVILGDELMVNNLKVFVYSRDHGRIDLDRLNSFLDGEHP